MVAVLDPDAQTGFHSGLFSLSAEDDEIYLITDGGAIPRSGVRGLTVLDEAQLSPVGADQFGMIGSSAFAKIGLASPVAVGDNAFEGRVQGVFHGESKTMRLASGAGFTPVATSDWWEVMEGASLDLWFAQQRYYNGENVTLAEAIDYTGGANGTYFDSSGVLQVSGTDEARLTHKYDSGSGLWVPRGIMGEAGATQVLPYTELFDDSTTGFLTPDNFAIEEVIGVGIDGVAYRHTGEGPPAIARTKPITLPTSTSCLVSLIMEKGTSTDFVFGIFDGAWIGAARYTWATGAITTVTGVVDASRVLPLGTGPNGGELVRVDILVTTGASLTDPKFYLYAVGTGAVTTSNIIHAANVQPGAPLGSSYVYCNGTTLTRTADVALIDGPEFAAAYDPAGSTIVVDFELDALVNDSHIFTFSDGTVGNRLLFYVFNGVLYQYAANAGVAHSTANLGPIAIGRHKLALRIEDNNAAASLDGNTAVAASSGVFASFDRLGVMMAYNNVKQLNGTTARLSIIRSPLVNAQLEALSAL